MKTAVTGLIAAMQIVVMAAAPPPDPPPGAGTAEWTLRRTIVMEAPVLRDSYLATFCGFRSSYRMGVLNQASRIINDALVDELRPKATDGARFTAYARRMAMWLDNSWRPVDGERDDPRDCDRVYGRLDRLDAVVDRLMYK